MEEPQAGASTPDEWTPIVSPTPSAHDVDARLASIDNANSDPHYPWIEPRPVAQRAAASRGSMVVVSSAKGGVGKSVIAANLAAGLVRCHGFRTVLVDANLEAGDQAVLFNVKQTRGLGLLAGLAQIDASVARELLIPASGGISLVPCPPDPVIAADVAAEAVRTAAEAYRDMFDFVIVDTHGGLDEVNLELFEAADRILLIVTPEMNTARHSAQFLNIARTLGYEDKIELILNRADSGLGAEALTECLGREITCRIVSAGPVFVQSANRAQLLFERDPSEKLQISRDLRRLVACVAGDSPAESVDRPVRTDRAESPAPTRDSRGTECEPANVAPLPVAPVKRGSRLAGLTKASLAGVGVAAALTVGVVGGRGVFGAQLWTPDPTVAEPAPAPPPQAPVTVTFEAMALGPEPGPTRTAVVPVAAPPVSTSVPVEPTARPPQPTPLVETGPVDQEPSAAAIAVGPPPSEAAVEPVIAPVAVSPEPSGEPASNPVSQTPDETVLAVVSPVEAPPSTAIGSGWTGGGPGTEASSPSSEEPAAASGVGGADYLTVVLDVPGREIISMHAGPSLSAATLKLLPVGTEAKLLGNSARGNNLPWQQVQVGSDVGWVLEAAVQPKVD